MKIVMYGFRGDNYRLEVLAKDDNLWSIKNGDKYSAWLEGKQIIFKVVGSFMPRKSPVMLYVLTENNPLKSIFRNPSQFPGEKLINQEMEEYQDPLMEEKEMDPNLEPFMGEYRDW